MKVIWNQGYDRKYYIWQQALGPLVMFINSIIDIVLLPTPYKGTLDTKYLGWVLKKQMQKRKRKYNEEKILKVS